MWPFSKMEKSPVIRNRIWLDGRTCIIFVRSRSTSKTVRKSVIEYSIPASSITRRSVIVNRSVLDRRVKGKKV
jgi:hypothetical protein